MCQQYQQASHDAAHGNDVLGTATAAHGQWARARFKPRPGGAEPAEAAMLGTRLQRAAILHLQQPAAMLHVTEQTRTYPCPNCGAEFTRTTARNGHLAHEKCKQRRNS